MSTSCPQNPASIVPGLKAHTLPDFRKAHMRAGAEIEILRKTTGEESIVDIRSVCGTRGQ